MTSFFQTFADPGMDLQSPAAVTVVMPSVLRPSLERALLSVFAQDIPGTVQVLIGIDREEGELDLVARVCRRRPPNRVVQVLYPGYSTSRRHGGQHAPRDGGALRLVLTSLANSRHVAYLDDDNWWAPDHLRTLRDAMDGVGAEWAFSLRWFVHPESGRPICVDIWESVGPGRGAFAERGGGFVDPNTLMIDQLACAWAVPWWNHPMVGDAEAMSADRNVFAALCRGHTGVGTGQATAYYIANPDNNIHSVRVKNIGPRYHEAGMMAGSRES